MKCKNELILMGIIAIIVALFCLTIKIIQLKTQNISGRVYKMEKTLEIIGGDSIENIHFYTTEGDY